MTAFAVNSGTQNFDSFAGASVNATLDTWTISAGATLLIDTDTYQCANHSTAAGSLDNVAFSGLGGTVKIDGTNVRVIAFNSGSGTVPAVGTAISRSGVSGSLLGVWADWQSEPLASGAAMPASGFIKVKNKTGGNFSAGALAGISATATGADVTGWIEVRGPDTGTVNIPRLGSFEVTGDWFVLGTTSGARSQVLQCPTTGNVAGIFPAIQIETAAGSGVYEWYLCMGTLAATANAPTDATRGKFVWQTTSGIRIGNDGTNDVGYLPAAGCTVRIPNVIFSSCVRSVSGSGSRVSLNDTLGNRQEFVTTSAGKITLSKCVMQWYCNFNKSYLVTCADSAFTDDVVVTTNAKPFSITNCAFGFSLVRSGVAFTVINHFLGGAATDCVFVKSAGTSSSHAVFLSSANGVTLTRCKSQLLTTRVSAGYRAFYSVFCNGVLLDSCTAIGGFLLLNSCVNFKIKNLNYVDTFFGSTLTTLALSAISIQQNSVNCEVDGVLLPIAGTHPYLSFVDIGASSGIKVSNIGAAYSLLDIGVGGNGCNYVVSSSGGNTDIKLRRCYVQNTRGQPYIFTNSDFGVKVENVFGDYADTTFARYNNGYSHGCGMAGSANAESAVYGTHWRDTFLSSTQGLIRLFCNEPTTETAAQAVIIAGNPIYTSQGNVLMPTIGDQIIFEMPYFALGHTGFGGGPLNTMAGNLSFEFQADTGSGYGGTWLSLDGFNLAAIGAVNPAVGVKLKIRVTATATNTANSLTQIAISTTTTDSAQRDNLYPLDQIKLTLTGLPLGCDIVFLQAGTSTILLAVDQNATSSYTYSYDTVQTVDIGILKPGYQPYYIRNYALATADASLPISLTPDRNYV